MRTEPHETLPLIEAVEWARNSGSGQPFPNQVDMLTDLAREMLAALKEIETGCINRRPGHVDYFKTRTRAEIEAIARAAIAKAEGR